MRGEGGPWLPREAPACAVRTLWVSLRAAAGVVRADGTLAGVRGFNDRAAPSLPNGSNIFQQPAADTYILPFHLEFNKTAASCMPAPDMGYWVDIAMFNGGLMDSWNTARNPGFGMSYFTREDLPWYYALADEFTIGDQYFQSTFTATNPNRLFLFSGSNGLSAPNSTFCMLDDTEPLPGFTWETYAESLQAANVSWRVIQELDNFDDNAFEWFESFRQAKPGTPLFDNGVMPVWDLVGAFEEMVATDTLPSVLWIVGPTALSEHATNHPADGEWLTSELIAVLSSPQYADVYAKTLFVLNYDEGGQFFDHHWPPVPPMGPLDGKSTVTTVGELTKVEEFGVPAGTPIGMGFRVPLILVSPWTRGHYVYSEVSDHASVLKFLEKRFGVPCPNISPWRRAVTSDLTAAFDFANPDYSWPESFPSTAQNVNQSKWECENLPAPTLPASQSMPVQEAGTRLARSLPYEFLISDTVAATGVTVVMNNTGAAGAVFAVFDLTYPAMTPRKYTVEGGKALDDVWLPSNATNTYNLSLHGPNGFVRKFSGTVSAAGVASSLLYTPAAGTVTVAVAVAASGAPTGACNFTVTDNAYGAGEWGVVVGQGGPAAAVTVNVTPSANWYDLTVSLVPTSSCGLPSGAAFTRRFMGHMENGKTTTSDPAMAAASPYVSPTDVHPEVPPSHRSVEKLTMAKQCASKRGRMKDACWSEVEARRMLERRREEL